MGSDKSQHKKKKQRTVESLRRQANRRASYDVVLIVCEDSKSVPNYLKGLRDDLQLSNVNIRILGCPSGTDPLNNVDYTLEKLEENKIYDRAYCVFDQDRHEGYQPAIKKINDNFSNGIPIYAIPSIPCFEYWLLLHFEETARPYKNTGKKSSGDQLVSELKKYMKGYNKGHKNIFEETKDLLDVAIDRAKKIDDLQRKNGTDNPSTKIYQLVEYLRSIKK